MELTLLNGALNSHEAPTLACSPLVGADMLAHSDTRPRGRRCTACQGLK